MEAYQAQNYAAASDKLNRAFEILRVPTLGLWSARALAKTGKLVEASERFLLVTRLDVSGDVSVQNQAKAEAASEREALLPKIPSLTIDVQGASSDAIFTLDGAPLQRALMNVRQPANPGRHMVSVRDGNRVLEREVTLTEGQRLAVSLDMAKAKETNEPPPTFEEPTASPAATTPGESSAADQAQSPGLPVGFWVGVGVAGAGVVTGSVAALLASQKKSDLSCPGDVCAPSDRDNVDSYNRMLTISTVGFVVAGVGAATAGVFLLTRPSASAQARHFSPYVGLGSAGVVGAF